MLKRSLAETEAKLREIIATLMKAGPDCEGGSRRKLKTNVLPAFPTSSQKRFFDANED